jgi:type II secretion system protein G
VVKLSVKSVAGFSLVELMIVVAILGILAAIVIPQYTNQSQKAKEAAAKENLRILRDAIERYALKHNGVPPGYPMNNPTVTPGSKAITDGLITGRYLTKLPENPFNKKNVFYLINNTGTFPASPTLMEVYGWVYQPATKTIRLNTDGKDSEGRRLFDY